MADIHDYMEAARSTDEALRVADVFHGQLEDGDRVGGREHAGERAVAEAILLAGRSIALAIREAAVRADYVTRDMGRRG